MKAVLIAAAALALAAPAFAAEDNTYVHARVEVRYGDLDLNTAQGQAEFRTRVNAAVVSACGPRDGQMLRVVMLCRENARADLVERASPRVRAALLADEPRRVASND